MGEKVKRLRVLRGWSQEQAARAASLGASTIAHIELGGREQLRPTTFRKLAQAFDVPEIYFRTDDPRQYARVRVVTAHPSELLSTASGRVRWLLQDLEEKWGENFSPERVAEHLGVSDAYFRKVLSGDELMSSHMVDGLSSLTGVPANWFVTGALASDDSIQDEYKEAALLAQSLSVDPAVLKAQIRLLAAAAGRGDP